MAVSGRKIDDRERQYVQKVRERLSLRETARVCGMSPVTVQKICGSAIAK